MSMLLKSGRKGEGELSGVPFASAYRRGEATSAQACRDSSKVSNRKTYETCDAHASFGMRGVGEIR